MDPQRLHKKRTGKIGFSKTTFDLGVVVSDLDQAAEFYTKVVGMTEVQGFSAPRMLRPRLV